MSEPVITPAVTAAGNALRERWLREHPGVADIRVVALDPMDWAQTAVEAAAPHMLHIHAEHDARVRAAEQERCAQLAGELWGPNFARRLREPQP